MKKQKQDFIFELNNVLIDMIKPEYRPEIKDMFLISAIDEQFPELEAAFSIFKKNGDVFSAIRSNITAIKECFVIHYQKNISETKKIALFNKNSKVRLDSLDIEELLEVLNSSDLKLAAKKLFLEY